MYRCSKWKWCVMLAVAGGAGACTIESEQDAEPAALCGLPLSQEVQAPAWVRNVSPIHAYRYRAGTDAVDAQIALLGEDGAELGTMHVSQLYGHPFHPDGAMHAELTTAGQSPISLTTVGEAVDAEAYRVRARLEKEAASVDVTATFAHRACYGFVPANAPLCVGPLPLEAPAFSLPSCGLLNDIIVGSGQAPTLERLTYAASLAGATLLPLGAARYGGAREIQVFGPDGLTDADAIAQWAQETGVDAVLGSESEVLLTTAFLDRSWWRELERHVSHCTGETADAPLAPQALGLRSCSGSSLQSEPVANVGQAVCGGSAAQPNVSDWSDDGGAQDTGGFWGDPHVTSLDLTAFDFQGVGEFTLVESVAGSELVIQARFEPMETASPLPACANVSVGTALAVQAGDLRVTAYARPDFVVRMDGQDVAEGQALALPDGGVLRVARGYVLMEWPQGERIELSVSETSRLRLALAPERRGLVRGLLGQFDGNPGNDFVTRDGRLIPAPPGFEALYDEFGASWRVTEEDSLFEYGPGEGPDDFVLPGFPSEPARVQDLPDDDADAAREQCAALEVTDPVLLDACVLDVVCAGPGAAKSAVGVSAPLAFLPMSHPQLMVEGPIALWLLPGEFDMRPWPDDGGQFACAAVEPRNILLAAESAGVTLSADLAVDEPGTFLSSGSVPAGTTVTSFMLHRRPGEAANAVLTFADPVLGVITSQDALDASDGVVGAASTTYPSEPRAADAGEDEVAISADGRSVAVSFSGADADQIRILTEAP